MSKVSDIFDALEAVVKGALPAYKELPNAYNPIDNPSIFLEKGFAIGIADGTNSERVVSPKVSIDRQYEIIFVNQINSNEMQTDKIKAESKQIFEDAFLVLKETEKDNDIGQLCVKAKYESDSGLGFLESKDSQRYFILTMVVSVEYFENL